jgi:hypothetical protein
MGNHEWTIQRNELHYKEQDIERKQTSAPPYGVYISPLIQFQSLWFLYDFIDIGLLLRTICVIDDHRYVPFVLVLSAHFLFHNLLTYF